MTTITVPTEASLAEIAVNRIIEQAAKLSRDKDLDVWRDVYEPAKRAIKEFGLSAEDYQSAIARLTEAMRV